MKHFIKKLCAVAVAVLTLSSTLWASDLVIAVNSSEQTLTITNNLNNDINLISLTNGTESFSTGDTIPANKSVTVRTSRDIPAGLTTALCRAASDAGIADRQADSAGVYTLSVSGN